VWPQRGVCRQSRLVQKAEQNEGSGEKKRGTHLKSRGHNGFNQDGRCETGLGVNQWNKTVKWRQGGGRGRKILKRPGSSAQTKSDEGKRGDGGVWGENRSTPIKILVDSAKKETERTLKKKNGKKRKSKEKKT